MNKKIKNPNRSLLAKGSTARSLTAEKLSLRLRATELSESNLANVTGGGIYGTSCGHLSRFTV